MKNTNLLKYKPFLSKLIIDIDLTAEQFNFLCTLSFVKGLSVADFLKSLLDLTRSDPEFIKKILIGRGENYDDNSTNI